MTGNNGPRVTITVSCTGCMHCDGEPYRCQGDSGVDYYCKEPTVGKKAIGPFQTPAWCPLMPPSPRDAALEEAANECRRLRAERNYTEPLLDEVEERIRALKGAK